MPRFAMGTRATVFTPLNIQKTGNTKKRFSLYFSISILGQYSPHKANIRQTRAGRKQIQNQTVPCKTASLCFNVHVTNTFLGMALSLR
jgi:hypothetical protein